MTIVDTHCHVGLQKYEPVEATPSDIPCRLSRLG